MNLRNTNKISSRREFFKKATFTGLGTVILPDLSMSSNVPQTDKADLEITDRVFVNKSVNQGGNRVNLNL
jgi:plastocyanin domain-containing protein